MRRPLRLVTGVLLALSLAGVSAGPASAEDPAVAEPSGSEVAETAAAIADVPGVADTVSTEAVVEPNSDTAVAVSDQSAETTIEIPSDPADGVSFDSPDGAISIGIPGARRAADAETVGATAVYTDAAPATTVAAQPTDDGGVRVLAVLDGSAAPTRFDYPLEIPSGATLQSAAGGEIHVTAESGEVIASIAPAWAVDANGMAVPTRYTVSGTTLSQYVEHGEGTVYPVVADPAVTRNCGWTSCSIYLSVTRTRELKARLNSLAVEGATFANSAAMCGAIGFASGPAGVLTGPACGAIWWLGMRLLKNTVDTAVRTGGCLRVSLGTRNSMGVSYGSPHCFLN